MVERERENPTFYRTRVRVMFLKLLEADQSILYDTKAKGGI